MGHFAKSTIYLAFTQYLSAIIGFIYRLLLAKTIGAIGMGIYEQALSFLNAAITLITAGIPAAISKLIAETKAKKYYDVKNIMLSAKFLIICFSIIGITLFTLLSKLFKSKLFILILPTAVLIGFSSIINGFFLGIQETKPLRFSILIDSISTFIFFLIARNSNLLFNIEGKTQGAITAIFMGELTSLIVLIKFYLITKNDSIKFKVYNLKKLIRSIKDILTIAIPISTSQIINSLSFSCKALLIPKCLQASGLTPSNAISLFGKTSGMAMPLLFFPSIIIISLSSNIIPKMSHILSKDNPNYAFRLAQKSIIATTCFSLFFASFFIVLSEPIADLFFKGNALKNIIACFAIGIPFFYTENILIALLRGVGNNKTPLVNSIFSFFIENILILLLVSMPNFSIYGYAISLITTSAICIFISINALEKKFGMKFSNLNIIVKPILCCILTFFISSKMYTYLELLGFQKILNIIVVFIFGASGYIAMAEALGLVRMVKN